ncbi:MAG: fumarylacetoacetate hydrolase family protein [Burkholderiaceae bacterium]
MPPASRPFALGMFSVPAVPGVPQPAALPRPFVGIVVDGRVTPLARLLAAARQGGAASAAAPSAATPSAAVPLADRAADNLYSLLQDWPARLDWLIEHVDRYFDEVTPQDRFEMDTLRAHAPIPEARQLICTGANYRQHVIDLVFAQGGGAATEGMTPEQRRADAVRRVDERAANGIPYAFPKLSGSLCGPQDDLVVPRDAEQLDWELELGVVIGRPAWRIPRQSAMDVVAGYLIVNDITRRELVYRSDLRSLGSDWLRAKSGPGFMPSGPLFVPAPFVADPHRLELHLELNGETMQRETTADMIFGIERQIEYLSSYVRLLPGDIIATGSPAGNGMHYGRFLRPGDVMRASITGLGTQVVRCIAEE